MTTAQLAEKFNVTTGTIHKAHHHQGHYRGYVPIGYEEQKVVRLGAKQYIWGKKKDDK